MLTADNKNSAAEHFAIWCQSIFGAQSEMNTISLSELTFGARLGEGTFGSVKKGEYKGNVVAIKSIKDNIDQKDILREITFLAMVKHENIIKLFGVSIGTKETHLVMEFLEGGSLAHFVHSSTVSYTLQDGIGLMRQAAEGLAHLHSCSERSVIHRDVKPLNMLLDASKKNLKICDFGFVRNVQTQMTCKRGTWAYMAPEVFKGSKYDDKCDVFSMGITIWEVLARKFPYYLEMPPHQKLKVPEVLKRIDGGLRPLLEDIIFDCPENIKALITSCWANQPVGRPSMQGIVDALKAFEGAANA